MEISISITTTVGFIKLGALFGNESFIFSNFCCTIDKNCVQAKLQL